MRTKTHGKGGREQSLRLKQPKKLIWEEPDVGGAWVHGSMDRGVRGQTAPTMSHEAKVQPRGLGAGTNFEEEEPRPGEEGPSNEPLDNLVNMVDGQKGDAESTDVALACEHGTRSQAHTLSMSTGGESPNPGG